MKKLSVLLLLFLGVVSLGISQSETSIILQGHYQGRNIYVQNPFGSSGVGFCVTRVTVNGDVTTDEIASSAFEIDFKNFQLAVGEEVEVEIFHKLDCSPKVINPQVLEPQSTFDVAKAEIKIDGDEVLNWKSTNETGKLTYIVEQYRWNKWIKVGEVEGAGTPGAHDYKFKVTTHSGENKFRVKQVDYTGRPRMSPAATYNNTTEELTFYPKKVKGANGKITFSKKTLFEIFDSFGNIVKKGYGDNVDCGTLKKGLYYLNFDNQNGEFSKN
ncbi:MAG: hypothetical protein JKY54_09725 [Flavobacteriales bacterium]|nr:hypothetical protein [Flavobacteriales bacterium]